LGACPPPPTPQSPIPNPQSPIPKLKLKTIFTQIYSKIKIKNKSYSLTKKRKSN
jgi:hypothetical protein